MTNTDYTGGHTPAQIKLTQLAAKDCYNIGFNILPCGNWVPNKTDGKTEWVFNEKVGRNITNKEGDKVSWKDYTPVQQDGSLDFSDIECNFGIKGGPCHGPLEGSYLLIIDFDKIKDSARNYKLLAGHCCAETPNGRHLYVTVTEAQIKEYNLKPAVNILDVPEEGTKGSVPTDNCEELAGLIIDFRFTNSYVVGHNSIVKGKLYRWITPPQMTMPQPCPKCYLEAYKAYNSTKQSSNTKDLVSGTVIASQLLKWAVKQIHNYKANTLNNTLNAVSYSVGRRIASAKISEDDARTALVNAAVEEGHPKPGAVATVNSGLTVGMEDPIEISAGLVIPGKNEDIVPFCKALAEVLTEKGLYLFNDRPVIVKDEKISVMTTLRFVTWASEQAELSVRVTKKGEDTVFKPGCISKALSEIILASDIFLNSLQKINKVINVGLPVDTKHGPVLLNKGYNADYSIYVTNGKDVKIEKWDINKSKNYIDELTKECSFTSPQAKSAWISSLLTGFLTEFFPDQLQPIFIATGNRPGCGKTYLGTMAILPISGTYDIMGLPSSEQELKKTLDSVVLSGANQIFFDNAKGYLDSSSLESFITSNTWTFRALGGNKTYTCDCTNTMVFLTGNNLRYSADIKRRSINIDLFSRYAIEDVRYEHSGTPGFILEQRSNILSACYGLLNNWIAKGRPTATVSTASFAPWCNTIGAILEQSGYGTPLGDSTNVLAGDVDSDDLKSLVSLLMKKDTVDELKKGEKFIMPFAGVAKLCLNNELFTWATEREDEEADTLSRKSRTKLSRALTKYIGQAVQIKPGLFVLFSTEGKDRAKVYTVCVVE